MAIASALSDAVAGSLTACRSLDDLQAAAAPLGLFTGGRRFLHLELDITNRCNIRCVMCYHSFESTRKARTVHLSPGDFSRIAASVLPHAYRLSLSLGNEPLMSPHFVGILRIAGEYAVPHVNLFTNGLLIDDEKSDAMIACGVTQVCVSVDGATRATYQAIRRDGDFDRLVSNVERLVARRDAAGRPTPRVRFDMVMMQRNVHEMPDLVRLAARLGADALNFRHIVAFEGLGMERESLQLTKALSNYWLEEALAAAAETGLKVEYHPLPFDLAGGGPHAASDIGDPFAATPYCPYPFFHISVGPGGHVLPCPFSHGEAPYGEVSDAAPLDLIWLGPKFTELRQRILRHDPPEMCRRCSFLADRHPDVPAFFTTRHF